MQHDRIRARFTLLLIAMLGACSTVPTPTPGTVDSATLASFGPQGTSSAVAFLVVAAAEQNGLQCDSSGIQRVMSSSDAAHLQETAEYKTWITCTGRLSDQRNETELAKLVPVYMRSALAGIRVASVVDRFPAGTKHRYRVTLTLTEFVPDIQGDKAAQERLASTLGWIVGSATPYVGAAAAPVMGPLTGLLSGFDVITGLPTDWKNAQKRGVVAGDVTVTDHSTGRIILAFPVAGQFGTEAKQVGRDLVGYYKRSVRSSSPEEALRIACLAAAKHISEKLKLAPQTDAPGDVPEGLSHH